MHSAIDIPNLNGLCRYNPLFIMPVSPITNPSIQKAKVSTLGPILQQKLDHISMRDFRIRQIAKKLDQANINNDEYASKSTTKSSVILDENQRLNNQASKKSIKLQGQTKTIQQAKSYIQQAIQVKPLNLIPKENAEIRSVSPSLERTVQLSMSNIYNNDAGNEQPLKRDLNSSSQFKNKNSSFWSRANMAYSSNPGTPQGSGNNMRRPNTTWNETKKKNAKKEEQNEHKRKEEIIGITGLPLSKKQLCSITKINIGDKMLSGYVLPTSTTATPTNHLYKMAYSSTNIAGESTKKNGTMTSFSHRALHPHEVRTSIMVASACESFRNPQEQTLKRRESIGNFPASMEAGITRQNPYNNKPSTVRQDNSSSKGTNGSKKQQQYIRIQTPVEAFTENISSSKKGKAQNIEVTEGDSEVTSSDLRKQNYMLVGDKPYKHGLSSSKKLKAKLDGSDVTKLGTSLKNSVVISTTLDKPHKVMDARVLRKLSTHLVESLCEDLSFELKGWGQDGDFNTEF